MSVPWYFMAKGKGGGGYKTASGPIVSVNDALAAPLRSLLVNIEPVQSGSGDPSPDNVRPISGWSAVNVWRTGKNLFDINGDTSFIYSDMSIQNNRIVISSIGSGSTSRVYFAQTYKPGTYTFSAKASGQIEQIRIFSYQPFIGGTYNAYYGGYYAELTNGQITVTMTEPFTIGVIAQGTARGQGEIYEIQFELGSTATPYEPYSGNQYTIQLGDTYYGGTLDVINGVLTVTHKMVDMGTLDYSKSSLVQNGFVATSGMPDDFPLAPSSSAIPNWICSNYGSIVSNNAIELESVDHALAWRVSGANKGIIVKDSDYAEYYTNNNMVAFKTAMSGVQLVYELDTPITIPLTPQEISTLQGANNLWADSGDITIEYLASGGVNADLMKLAVAFMGRR